MKIEQLQFNNFRAYRKETFNIPLEKNIILLYARNGFGKTSFFDGIEWGLTGKIERYNNPAKEKNEYPVLRNSFVNTPSINDGIYIKFTTGDQVRRGIKCDLTNDYGKGTLFLNDENIDNLNHVLVEETFLQDVNLEKSFNFTQLLSQELISNFIRHTKDPDRYKTIVDLFGLSSYKNYDLHISQAQKFLKDKIENLEEELKIKRQELAVENAKLKTLDIDPQLMLEELESIHNFKIEFKNLTDIKELYMNSKKEKEIELNKLKDEFSRLKYLETNYKDKEEKIKKYSDDYNLYTSLEKFVREFSKKKFYDNILENIDNYNEYIKNEETILASEKKLIDLKDEEKRYSFFNNNQTEDELIINLSDYKKEYKERVESFINAKKQISTYENSIKSLQENLQQISSLKNALLYSAKQFLSEKENENLSNCPVCENQFDINHTLMQISEKLDKGNLDLDFKEVTRSIDDLFNLKKEHIKFVENEKNTLYKLAKSVLEIFKKEYDELLKINVDYDKLRESYTIVIESLYSLSMDIKDFNSSKEKFFLELKSSSEYKDSVSEQFYFDLLNEQRIKLNSDYEEIKHYIEEKKVFSIENYSDISKKLINNSKSFDSVSLKIDSYKKALELASELIVFSNNNNLIKKIELLDDKIKRAENEIHNIKTLSNDYDNLKSAVKTSIDNETRDLLSSYKETIESFYDYLNPSLYMKELNIKIHENPTMGNRLIFEVLSITEKKHSPSYIFSSAQNNVLALSIFLSFAIKQKWSKLDTIFLDDPIQNMDDINIHSFVDLIRTIQKNTNKQFFISTHDDRIYNFMLNKFGEDDVHSFEYEDYGVIKRKTQRN